MAFLEFAKNANHKSGLNLLRTIDMRVRKLATCGAVVHLVSTLKVLSESIRTLGLSA